MSVLVPVLAALALTATLGAAPALVTPAQLPGLLSPLASANTMAITAGPGTDAAIAAHEVRRAIDQTWTDVRTVVYAGDAGASDCRVKAFTADAEIEADQTRYDDGVLVEVTFDLHDCGGWEVNQWTSQRLLPAEATRPQIVRALRTLARHAATDADVWRHMHAARARRLLTAGLAMLPGDPPTYLYALYKTPDGRMRVAVRPGGPAWEAGIRPGDVLVKLDGTPWWDYGTFQTERRAYDGLPHTLLLERGKRRFTVALGAPLIIPTSSKE